MACPFQPYGVRISRELIRWCKGTQTLACESHTGNAAVAFKPAVNGLRRIGSRQVGFDPLERRGRAVIQGCQKGPCLDVFRNIVRTDADSSSRCAGEEETMADLEHGVDERSDVFRPPGPGY